MSNLIKASDETLDITTIETREWLESLDYVLQERQPEQVRRLLKRMEYHARLAGIQFPFSANTPYINTIAPDAQPPFPGDRQLEQKIENIIRWNAMAMVVRANKEADGIGGHISTYASAATLYEVGFNHFFRAKGVHGAGDMIYFQGHASPGIYARAFVEGRLSQETLANFRRELKASGGLPSYPHPRLMPDFWEFPTVSMGLSPLMAIYQARFNRYLAARGLANDTGAKVWAFLGDGETDEPEALGAITLAAREKLDNLIFVINCNLQRLDGPVRGNGNIIQELERIFRGAGWNVIKVIWGSAWDPLLARDDEGVLVERLGQIVDGEYQKYAIADGGYLREHLFGPDPRLQTLVGNLADQQLEQLNLGGHDPLKVYTAYHAAVEHTGSPTVILARTIKGYGLGEASEGKNVTHQQKKLDEAALRDFRDRFDIPISDQEIVKIPFYLLPDASPEMKYLRERRERLDGYVPKRTNSSAPLPASPQSLFEEFYGGSKDREEATTMAFARILSKLLRDKQVGPLIVPIVPDEARTFGMDALFRQVGIYSYLGQTYEPVDADNLLYYKEAKDGQILEEGITEAGSMASFIAAGTAGATQGLNTIPFFIFYSMFGFQRIGDLIWAAGDARARGFLVGATAGRTTLAGEGLQHQDGHSHLLAHAVPNLVAYDPAFTYELAVIIREGIRRMYEEQEDIFYYLTVENEKYSMPPLPDGDQVKVGILKGMYKLKPVEDNRTKRRAQLFGSGAIINEVLKAQELLVEKYGVAADVWSVTSYQELYRDALQTERWNRLHPTATARLPYVTQCLTNESGVLVAASDYVKALPYTIAPWLPRSLIALGTDGFGRSDTRQALRNFFEVDARHITLATLTGLAREGEIGFDDVEEAIHDLEINPDKVDPMLAW